VRIFGVGGRRGRKTPYNAVIVNRSVPAGEGSIKVKIAGYTEGYAVDRGGSRVLSKPLKCPWCGTSDYEVRTNCRNCGGPLPERETAGNGRYMEMPLKPPPPPREISKNYVRKLMFGSGWGVAAAIFAFIGGIFFFVGLLLTALIVTAFVGIPFIGMGAIFGVAGSIVLKTQYDKARKTVEVLRSGNDTEGLVTEVGQNMMVRINGRNPYNIGYEYSVDGRRFTGSVQTLQNPLQIFRPGCRAWVLYSPGSPETSTLYPHP